MLLRYEFLDWMTSLKYRGQLGRRSRMGWGDHVRLSPFILQPLPFAIFLWHLSVVCAKYDCSQQCWQLTSGVKTVLKIVKRHNTRPSNYGRRANLVEPLSNGQIRMTLTAVCESRTISTELSPNLSSKFETLKISYPFKGHQFDRLNTLTWDSRTTKKPRTVSNMSERKKASPTEDDAIMCKECKTEIGMWTLTSLRNLTRCPSQRFTLLVRLRPTSIQVIDRQCLGTKWRRVKGFTFSTLTHCWETRCVAFTVCTDC